MEGVDHQPRGGPRPSRTRGPGGVGDFLLPPLLLGATLTGVLLVLRGPDHIFGWTLASVVGLALLWLIASALFPAKADRKCPRCAAEALERLDRERMNGLVCAKCGWRDDSASGFLLAEDEGVPLEPMVLERRAERRVERDARPSGGVDKPRRLT